MPIYLLPLAVNLVLILVFCNQGAGGIEPGKTPATCCITGIIKNS